MFFLLLLFVYIVWYFVAMKFVFLTKIAWSTLYGHPVKAIPIKCFVSHRPSSREGGSVGRSGKKKEKKKKNEHMTAY